MAGYALKVKTKGGQQIVQTLLPESTIKELIDLLSKFSNIPITQLQVLSGFPPKALNLSDENQTLMECGITSGDTLILEERLVEPPPVASVIVHEQRTNDFDNDMDEPLDCPGILMKHIVPADNSCLFTSIHFVLNGKVDETGTISTWMRQIIAETVGNDLQSFSEAILGKPNAEYCKWILDDKSWGGGIEIAILSDYYGIEIAVVDTINAIINRFGEDKNYPHRVFLMFDGIHYDPLFLEPFDGGKVRTIFPSSDEKVYADAEQLANEAKSSGQYTDVNKFTLKCLVCNIQMSGQVQAQQHAQSTGHTNFGEI